MKRTDFLKLIGRWSETADAITTTGSSFSKWSQECMMSLGQQFVICDELGTLKNIFQLKVDKNDTILQTEGFSALLNFWSYTNLKRSFVQNEYCSDVPKPIVNATVASQTSNVKGFMKTVKGTGYESRNLYWHGTLQSFIADGYLLNGNNIDTLKIFEFKIFLQFWLWYISLNTSVPTLLAEFPEFSTVSYDPITEIYINRIEKLLYYCKKKQQHYNPDYTIASVIQKYSDLVKRLGAQMHVAEETINNLVRKTGPSIKNLKSDLQKHALLNFTITDPHIIISSFYIIFNCCFPNFLQLTDSHLLSFGVKAEDMNLEFGAHIAHLQELIEDEEKEICDNGNNDDDNQLQRSVSIEMPIEELSQKPSPLSEFILISGSILMISAMNEMKRDCNAILKCNDYKQRTEFLKSVCDYYHRYGMGDLIQTEIKGATWIFRKEKLSENVDDLTDPQATFLASLRIPLKSYISAYNKQNNYSLRRDKSKYYEEKLINYVQLIKRKINGQSSHESCSYKTFETLDKMIPRQMDVDWARKWLRTMDEREISMQNNINDSDNNKPLMQHFKRFIENDFEWFEQMKQKIDQIYSVSEYAQLQMETKLHSGALRSFVLIDNDEPMTQRYQMKSTGRLKLDKDGLPPLQIRQYLDAQNSKTSK